MKIWKSCDFVTIWGKNEKNEICRLLTQIAILNQNLEEKRMGVLKTSGHLLFKTLIGFSPNDFIVGDIAQKIG